MPITGDAAKVKESMQDQYGDDWESVFYATANKQGRKPETWEKKGSVMDLQQLGARAMSKMSVANADQPVTGRAPVKQPPAVLPKRKTAMKQLGATVRRKFAEEMLDAKTNDWENELQSIAHHVQDAEEHAQHPVVQNSLEDIEDEVLKSAERMPSATGREAVLDSMMEAESQEAGHVEDHPVLAKRARLMLGAACLIKRASVILKTAASEVADRRGWQSPVSHTLGRVGNIPQAIALGTTSGMLDTSDPAMVQKLVDAHDELHPKDEKKTGLPLKVNAGGGLGALFDNVGRVWSRKDTWLPTKVIGSVASPLGDLVGMIGRGDHYNPWARSITSYANHPSVVAHELGHAADEKNWWGPGGMMAARMVPFVSIPQEYRATTEGTKILERAQENDDKLKAPGHSRMLSGGLGSYVGGALHPAAALPGALAGQAIGAASGAFDPKRRKAKKDDSSEDDGSSTEKPKKDDKNDEENDVNEGQRKAAMENLGMRAMAKLAQMSTDPAQDATSIPPQDVNQDFASQLYQAQNPGALAPQAPPAPGAQQPAQGGGLQMQPQGGPVAGVPGVEAPQQLVGGAAGGAAGAAMGRPSTGTPNAATGAPPAAPTPARP